MRERLERELSERYAIERELGRGGMASVWLAHDRRDDRAVAIKILDADLAGAIGADRFVREIRLTTRLQHPGIVPVLDSGVLPASADVALPWYAMPYIAGESLRARLQRETQLPIGDAVRIARAIADALLVAHRQGIVHRDIKPENVILSGDDVFVVDFGIAKALLDTGAERLTSTGLAIGTPVYMSPEQAMAAPVDARTDQYSLAAVLYEMLVGEPPVTGPNTQAIIARRLTAPVQSIRTVRPTVPPVLEAAVLRALERVPADRFPDVTAFAAALEGSSSTSPAPNRRVRRTGLVLGGATLAIVAAVAASMTLEHRAASPARTDPQLVTLYQRGVREYDRRTPSGAREAIAAFDAALARDSSFARGWVGLAKTYIRIYDRRFDLPGVSRDSVLALAVVAADRALVADSTDAQAWAAQALVRRAIDPTDVEPGMRAARRAIALDSLDAPSWHYLALGLAESGKMDEAIGAWRESVRGAPTYTQGLAFLAQGLAWRKQFDSAKVWADSAVAVDPNYLLGRTGLGETLSNLGEQPRAIAAFDAARRLASGIEIPNTLAGRAMAEARAGRSADARATLRQVDSLASGYVPTSLHTAVFVAQAYAQLGDVDRAMSWLTRYPTHADLHYQLHLHCDAALAPLVNDTRYRALLRAGTRVGDC